MKLSTLFFTLFFPVFCYSQIIETFSDGNFTENPSWTGDVTNFIVNGSLQLQSSATVTTVSKLFTSSEAFDNAIWECTLKINYTTSSSNYASVYIIANSQDFDSNDFDAYYVQVGGTNDEVSLFLQKGSKKSKIIDGTDKRTDGKPVDMKVKVTRDDLGNFTLYSKLSSETEYFTEGKVNNVSINKSNYFGLLYSNTSTTGAAYYFDDISVSGDKAIDVDAPLLNSITVQQPNILLLKFSESVDFSSAVFEVDKNIGVPKTTEVALDKNSITLYYQSGFEKGELYTLSMTDVKDLSGNELIEKKRFFGITEPAEHNDIIINEVMFENPLNSLEYIEIFNKSEKLLDISDVVFSTRKTDGSFNTVRPLAYSNIFLPGAFLAICSDENTIRNYHNCPENAIIISTSWSDLNNESSTIVLMNSAKDTIYDELTYSAKWHHVLVKNPKGVALERVNPELPTQVANSWHSAASEVKYGTPGFKNSQYREIDNENSMNEAVWVEPEAFTPDNDGIDDSCIIHYKTKENGFTANVLILNSVGVLTKTIASNLLLSNEGSFLWDGTTNKSLNVNPGIYVLYFEMINTENGNRQHFKLPVVVSAR